jgi:hypothetical protein
MEIKAQVQNISKLKDYFFIVPDYQREYVWKVDDEVEQFLVDIDNEFEPNAKVPSSYFIGSIIIVKNAKKYDVIDGQQRLTTIVLTMCAFRDVMKEISLDETQANYLKAISEWLSNFDVDAGKVQLRLELQYEESKDFLATLIQEKAFSGEMSASIQKMRSAYERIKQELESYLQISVEALTEFAAYFLTKIDLVVIESENLSSALKIFETINQRGAGLNAMDLIKNLLFSKASPDEFTKIKEKWKELTAHLHAAREDDKPLRFLRYFLMARYYNGILREDDIYKWVISPVGKAALNFESKPYTLAVELERMAKRYADLVNATELQQDGGDYPDVTRIGFINKVRSRQHLILLLALDSSAPVSSLNYLAKQLESFFFFNNTLGIQAKDNERLFSQWATKLRGLKEEDAISVAVQDTILKELMGKVAEFKERFLSIRHSAYDPGYRLRFVLGRMENTLISQAGLTQVGLKQINSMQVEHILPQTPMNGVVPPTYAASVDEYQNQVYRLGNVTLLESQINQAVNNFNDLNSDWFRKKQDEYVNSTLLTPKLLDDQFAIGNNTGTNRLRSHYAFEFKQWEKVAIGKRQSILLDLAMETWKINDKRIDEQYRDAEQPAG